MEQNIRVVILEDDPFARNWMVLIAVRDWRTRVVGEASSLAELAPFLKSSRGVDLIIIDTDIPGGEDWLPEISKRMDRQKTFPKVLCTGLRANPKVLRQLNRPAFMGYILKGEICYSLAWAVSKVMNGDWVVTEGVQKLADAENIALRKPCKVLNGKNVLRYLPKRKAEIARLVISSILRKEIADELVVSDDVIYQTVSTIYDSIGVKDGISDEQTLREHYGDDDLIISFIKRFQQELKSGKRPKDIETLAFHVITMPEMTELA